MKFEELKEEIQKDFTKLDQGNLAEEATMSMKLFSKYLILWGEENLTLTRVSFRAKKLENLFWKILDGKGTPEENKNYPEVADVIVKTDTAKRKFVEAHPLIVEAMEAVTIQQIKVDLLKECVSQLQYNRTKEIGNALAALKYQSGA